MPKSAQQLVILGASGDLTSRLLLPGLGTLLAEEPRREVEVIGVARSERSDKEWRETVRTALTESKVSEPVIDSTVRRAKFIVGDSANEDDLKKIISGLRDNAVLYFALPPQVTVKICSLLADIELPQGLRLALEKPFGYDQDSAKELNETLQTIVPETQIYRVDHFLGRATVLDVLGFRFANRIFEPIWNAQNIERVEIVYDETLALEGRAGYYDKAGALSDMLQSHLLLLLAMVTMEEPSRLDEVELRDLMAHALRSTQVVHGDPVKASRRARYTAGVVHETQVASYAEEDGVDPKRETETLAEILLHVRNARWEGVPFLLRSGKAIGRERSQVAVTFRPVRYLPAGLTGPREPNTLTLDLKPQRITLGITTNAASRGLQMENTLLQADLGDPQLRPYGEILGRIFDGDPLLSVRGDVAEECWRIVEPVIEAWRADKVPLDEYAAGTVQPKSWDEPLHDGV